MYTKKAVIEHIKGMTEVCANYADTLNDECYETYILKTLLTLKWYNEKIISDILMYVNGECDNDPPFDPPFTNKEA